MMIRLWTSSALLALLLPVLAAWGQEQTEQQIDKMQEAAFNTPGAEAPVPGTVLAAGAGLLVGHFVVGKLLLRLRIWQTILSLLLGLAAGTALTLVRLNADETPGGDPA
jgi:hypothetical protein